MPRRHLVVLARRLVPLCTSLAASLGIAACTLAAQAPSPPIIRVDSAHNGHNRAAGLCEANCFDAIVAHQTPAFVALDAPQSVTLVHRSDRAHPMGTVVVDVVDTAATPAVKMSIALRRPDNSLVTLVTGGTAVFFGTGNGASRLAAQFDAASLATGAYDYTAVITSYAASGATTQVTAPVKVLVSNGSGSAVGWGWSLAETPRIVEQADGSLVVTEGDGSIAWFARIACPSTCTYDAPDGDFSTITRRASWPDGIKWDRIFPDGSLQRFRSDGWLANSRDRFANGPTYRYTGSRLDSITVLPGQSIRFAYNAAGKVSTMTDPAGRATILAYDAGGDLTQITDPDGVVALGLTYDATHRVTHRIDRRGGTWRFAYDHARRIMADSAPAVTINGPSFTSPVTRFVALETVALVDPASGTGTLNNPAPRRDPSALRATITPPRGQAIAMRLDRHGALTRSERGFGRTHVIDRDTHGRPVRTVSPSGHTMAFTYQANGPFVTVEHDSTTGRRIQYEYTGVNNMLTRVFGHTVEIRHFLDAGQKRVDSTSIGGAAATRYTYDTKGRVRAVRDPLGFRQDTLAFATSGAQNLVLSIAPGDRRTRVTHDAAGRVDSVIDARGFVSRTVYDALNRVRTTIGPEGDTTRLEYDSLFLRSVTDAKGQRTRFSPNRLGWDTLTVFPDSSYYQYDYDANGNMMWRTGRGRSSYHTYDPLDRPASIQDFGDYPRASATIFAYDATDRWMAVSNGTSTDTLLFDVAGRLQYEIARRSGRRTVVESQYDTLDVRTRLLWWGDSIPPGRRVLYTHDAARQLSGINDLQFATNTLTHNPRRQATEVIFAAGGLRKFNTYSSVSRRSEVSYNISAVDGAFRRTFHLDSMIRIGERWAKDTDTSRVYEYDQAGRLHHFTERAYTSPVICSLLVDQGRVCAGADTTVLRQEDYIYDKVGNRVDRGATYAAGNQLTAFDGFTLEHNAAGDLTRKAKAGQPDQTFTWNGLGQLISTTKNGVTTTFAYDGFGRRIRKSVAGVETGYLYDGDHAIVETNGVGVPQVEYVFWPGLDRPFSLRVAGENYLVAEETPGHVVGLIRAGTNAIAARYRYSPWGVIEQDSGSVPGALRFGARPYDVETGLYFQRARYYDPELARFISEDPIEFDGGVNFYVFAGNDPVNKTDPYGMCPQGQTLLLDVDENTGEWSAECSGGGVHQLAPVTVTAKGPSLGPYNFQPGKPSRGPSGSGGGSALSGNGANELMGGYLATLTSVGTASYPELAIKRNGNWIGCSAKRIRFPSTDLRGHTGTWSLNRIKIVRGSVPIRGMRLPYAVGIYGGVFRSPSYPEPAAAVGQVFCSVGVGLFEANP